LLTGGPWVSLFMKWLLVIHHFLLINQFKFMRRLFLEKMVSRTSRDTHGSHQLSGYQSTKG
uniref:Uncharacterized protein n=1 Tax=Amphimedon queenslandica TaxID=400682 RepID=A0A1X7TDY1_AMPQE